MRKIKLWPAGRVGKIWIDKLKPFLYRRSSRIRGQALTEYVLMMVMCVVLMLAMLLFLAAFTQHGARLIGFIAWEPNPPSYNEMNNIMSGL